MPRFAPTIPNSRVPPRASLGRPNAPSAPPTPPSPKEPLRESPEDENEEETEEENEEKEEELPQAADGGRAVEHEGREREVQWEDVGALGHDEGHARRRVAATDSTRGPSFAFPELQSWRTIKKPVC